MVLFPLVMIMKQCEYCAKEISYHEMYCSSECEKKHKNFYQMRNKFSKLFSVINGIFVLLIGICIFGYSFLPEFGIWGAVGSLTILGVMYLFLPFPPEAMIHKYKLGKSIRLSRIIATILLILAAVAACLHLFGLI